MENFLNLVKKRYSVRDFSLEQVEEQKLQYITDDNSRHLRRKSISEIVSYDGY
jgi:hypothetical protein